MSSPSESTAVMPASADRCAFFLDCFLLFFRTVCPEDAGSLTRTTIAAQEENKKVTHGVTLISSHVWPPTSSDCLRAFPNRRLILPTCEGVIVVDAFRLVVTPDARRVVV